MNGFPRDVSQATTVILKMEHIWEEHCSLKSFMYFSLGNPRSVSSSREMKNGIRSWIMSQQLPRPLHHGVTAHVERPATPLLAFLFPYLKLSSSLRVFLFLVLKTGRQKKSDLIVPYFSEMHFQQI